MQYNVRLLSKISHVFCVAEQKIAMKQQKKLKKFSEELEINHILNLLNRE